MSQKKTIVRNYAFEDISISVTSDNLSWADSFASYLSLTPGESCNNTKSIELTLSETGPEELEQLIPLPAEQFFKREKTLLVDRPIPYRVYAGNGQRWVDFSGFGRSWIDSNNKKARVVRLNNNGISPVYADVIFGYNPLLSLLDEYGYFTVHASCVQVGGRGVLFTGNSGRGKSTAAYAMLRRGHPILADDRILIKKDASYRALAISDVIKLERAAQQAFFPELRTIKPLHQVNDELYYKITSVGNLPYLNSTPANYLMIFERTATAESRLEQVNPSRVVGELFPVTMGDYSPEVMEKDFNYLMDLLENIQCYQVYFGTDMNHFANCIENLVTGGAC